MKRDRKAYNSTLRPVSKKRQAEIASGKRPKKPMARGKKPECEAKGATTIERLLGEGKVFKASSLPKQRKATGEKALFDEIWEERKHRCEVCHVPLNDRGPSNFSHLLPKNAYPDYRLDKRNVIIKCKDCHDLWHRWYEKLGIHHQWRWVAERYLQLKREAHGAGKV